VVYLQGLSFCPVCTQRIAKHQGNDYDPDNQYISKRICKRDISSSSHNDLFQSRFGDYKHVQDHNASISRQTHIMAQGRFAFYLRGDPSHTGLLMAVPIIDRKKDWMVLTRYSVEKYGEIGWWFVHSPLGGKKQWISF
jgi:hypothetical protein